MNKEEAKRYVEQMAYEKRLEWARKHPKENEDYKQMLKEFEGEGMNKYEENPEKYAMGEDIQTTKHHTHYSHFRSAEENYKEGLKYAREHHLSKLWVGKSLMQLHNLTHKAVFKEAAEKAYRAYRKEKREAYA